MSKDKPSPFSQFSSDPITREFKRHGFMVRVTTRPLEFVPLSENVWGITLPNDGEPRGLDSVRQIAKQMREFLDTRDVSHNVHRLTEKGYGPLTDEGLAARLLAAAEGMLAEGLPLEYRLGKAVELGRVEVWLNIMLGLSERAADRGKAPKKKPWVEELARDLIRRHPEKTKEELWNDLPEFMGDHELIVSGERWYVWRDIAPNKNDYESDCDQTEYLWAILANDTGAVKQKGPASSTFFKKYLVKTRCT